MEKTLNPVVRAQLKAFEKSNPDTGLNESELFEVFSIFSITNGILTDNIDPFAAHLKGKEFGIDGISIIIQGELCINSDEVATSLNSGKNHLVEFNIFQSKTSEKADYGDLSKFFDASFNFFNSQFLNPTDQLCDLLAAKDAVYEAALKKNPKLRLLYTTTGSGEKSRQIDQLIDSNITRFSDLNIFSEVDFAIFGAKEMQAGYRSATNSISEKIDIIKPITLPDHPSVQQAFLGLVAAEQLVQLATTNNDEDSRRINRAVFFDNIRDFNPESNINKGILKELIEGNQESFIFKNNGVTVVAKEINRKGDTFELIDYQIVNGCQTTNILFQAGDAAKGVSVPFRLIGSNDSDFVSSIIVGTNKQNEVRDDQFWALTPFMKDLEEYCREQNGDLQIFVERRENQYRNETVERTRICRPGDLVKAISAMFLFQPHRSARDYRGIRREFASKIFQDGHSVIPYHIAAYLSFKIDFLTRNKRVPSSWGIYKYYLISSIGQQFTDSKDIFSMKRGKQDSVCDNIIGFCTDEEKLTKKFGDVASLLDEMIKSAEISTREKIRDFIRTESVSNQFNRDILSSILY